MSKSTIFPDNATPLEIAMERAISKTIQGIPSPFPSLWRPDSVPLEHIPWLASSLGVYEWDESASESDKRETLKSNWANQRQAGMGVAIRRAIEPLGIGVFLHPWYEYGGEPYHFEIEINLGDKTLSPVLLSRVTQRINESKSERDVFSILVVTESLPGEAEDVGSAYFAAMFTDIVIAESNPYPQTIESGPE